MCVGLFCLGGGGLFGQCVSTVHNTDKLLRALVLITPFFLIQMKGLLQHSYLISRLLAWGSTNCVFTEELEADIKASTNTISNSAMKTVNGVFGGLSTITRTLRLERDFDVLMVNFQCLQAAQMKLPSL